MLANVKTIYLCVAIVLGWAAWPTQGQTIIDGGTARENAQFGEVLQRAPGRMVNSGVARARSAVNLPFGGGEITEQSPPDELDARVAFLVDATEILFERLNEALLYFENLLRARRGWPPRVPETPPPDDDDDRGGGVR